MAFIYLPNTKSMKEIISNSKLAKVSDIIDQVMFLDKQKKPQVYNGLGRD